MLSDHQKQVSPQSEVNQYSGCPLYFLDCVTGKINQQSKASKVEVTRVDA